MKIITLDGHVAAGKGKTSKLLAERLGFEILDTGSIYRAAAYIWNGKAIDVSRISFEKGVLSIDGKPATDAMIRTPEISNLTSQIAQNLDVRSALLPLIRSRMSPKGLIADGRDMGSTVFPDAKLKIFLTADAHVRAKRVLHDPSRGYSVTDFSRALAEILDRDNKDETRIVSPLKKAPGAIVLDTSHLTEQEVVDTIIELWRLKNQ